MTKEEGATAASSFAKAAALYAQGMSQPAPALVASCLSSAASDASSLSEDTSAFSFFVPLHEECEPEMGKAPKPDQSWWEEFGEWESASTVSPLPQIPHVIQDMANATQPRLVVGDQIVSLPVMTGAAWSYDSFPQLSNLIQRSVSEDEEFLYSPGALGPLPDWGLSSQVGYTVCNL